MRSGLLPGAQLDQYSVTCLVVPCVEAVLEDAYLNVVPLLAFVPRNGFRLTSDLGAFNTCLVKVSVSILSVLCLDRYLSLVVLNLDGCHRLCRLLVGNLKGSVLLQIKIKA